jgi:hypothetical protein
MKSPIFWRIREYAQSQSMCLGWSVNLIHYSGKTYRRQFWNSHCQCGQQIYDEICQIIMGVVSADQEQYDWHRHQILLCRCVLISIVNLLPHVEIVESTSVEIKRNAANPVKHDIRPSHVRDVGQSPGQFLGDAGPNIEKYLEREDKNWMYEPSS